MKCKMAPITLMLMLFIAVSGYSDVKRWNMVDVRIISDNGNEFSTFQTYPRFCRAGAYFYMEAAKGERYSIQISNRSHYRIGVVIAVDGRNIISAKKSDLKNNERMYIIEPNATNTFEGWRTGMDRTNRFYFTEQSNSYAEKVFSDGSAMGTIAVAAYREKTYCITPAPYDEKISRSKEGGKRLYSERPDKDKSCEQAGTGFGETTFSPVREVPFEPENKIFEKVVLKYEWRAELCRKGIISCGPQNRFWPDTNGFAPIPRDFKE